MSPQTSHRRHAESRSWFRRPRWMLAVIGFCSTTGALPADLQLDRLGDGIYAILETAKGPVLAELFFETAPLTVTNFVGLAEGTIHNGAHEFGEPYFNGLPFHRVIPGFIVQTGDPEGNGRSGPGYTFPDEFAPELRHGAEGTLSMANEGPNTNGSQFFITLDARQDRLNYKHSVFGRVIQGMDVVQSLEEGGLLQSVSIIRQGDRAVSFGTGEDSWQQRLGEFPAIPPAAGPLPHFFDFAELEFPIWFPKWLSEKLYHFEVTRGVSVHVRSFRSFLPALEGQTPQDFARHHYAMLVGGDETQSRHAQRMILFYFAEPGSWFLYGSPRLHPLLHPDLEENYPEPEDWERLVEHLVEKARANYAEPNARRLMDEMVTQILLLLDGHEHPASR